MGAGLQGGQPSSPRFEPRPAGARRIAVMMASAYWDDSPDVGRPGVQPCRFRVVTAETAAAGAAADRAGDASVAASHAAASHAAARFQARRLETVIACAADVLRETGRGELCGPHLALEGAIASAARLAGEAGEAAALLTGQGVDAVLAVPM
jgi:hypothetical protein